MLDLVDTIEPVVQPPTISDLLLQEAAQAEDWLFRDEILTLYKWYDIFNTTMFSDASLPLPIIGFAAFNKKTLARYNIARNEIGLRNYISFNERHFNTAVGAWAYGLWSQLESLLHEMVHAWQQTYGVDKLDVAKITARYTHNPEFIAKCESLGLHPRPRVGSHMRVADGWFADLMAEHGIPAPEGVPTESPGKYNWWQMGQPWKTSNRAHKWQCPCGQIVRVTKADFPGCVCVSCGEPFVDMTALESAESSYDESEGENDADRS